MATTETANGVSVLALPLDEVLPMLRARQALRAAPAR
jgi:hypothetical protein